MPLPVRVTVPADQVAALSGIHPSLLEKLEKRLSWRWALILWAVLFQVLMVIYGPSLPSPFLYDDFSNIVNNADFRSENPVAAVLAGHPSSMQFDRRPVGGLLSLLNFRLSGLSEKAFRATNLVIHWLAAGALGFLAWHLASRFPGMSTPRLFALLLALLWAVHPIQSTAVIYISQRMESLMTLFFLISCTCLLQSREGTAAGWWRAASGAAALLCLLSKENGAGLLILLPVLDRYFVRGAWKKVFTDHWRFYLILTAGWVAAAFWILNGPRVGEWDDIASLASPWRYFQTECRIVFEYLRLVFWPSPMVFAPVPRVAESPGDWLPYFAVLLVLFGTLGWMAVRSPWMWTPLLGILLVLAPTSSFIPVPLEPAFDYRMHLPSAGVLAFALVGLGLLARRLTLPSGPLLIGLGAAALALAATTRHRAVTYAQPETIWLDVVRKEPMNVKAWFNLAAVFIAIDRLDEARAAAAQGRLPNGTRQLPWIETQYHRMLALADEKEEKWEEAATHLREAVNSEPDEPFVRIDLARILLRLGRPGEALEQLGTSAGGGRLVLEATAWKAVALRRLDRPEEAQKAVETVANARHLSPMLEEIWQSMTTELSRPRQETRQPQK